MESKATVEEATAKLAQERKAALELEADVTQHTNYLLQLEEEDLLHSLAIVDSSLQELLRREQAKNPVERLEALRATATNADNLAINVGEIQANSPIIKAGYYESMAAAFPSLVEANPHYVQIEIAARLQKKKADIIQGIKEFLQDLPLTEEEKEQFPLKGTIPKLEASIKAAEARFDAINQSTFQQEEDRPKRLQTVQSSITEIDTLAIADADEEAHYGVLLAAFSTKLEGSIQAAVDRFNTVNHSLFQKEENRPSRLEIAQAALAGIKEMLEIPDADEEAHYEALLHDFVVKLEASIKAAEARFDAINQGTFQQEKDRPKRLQVVQSSIIEIDTLAIADVDEKTHYGVLLDDFKAKLEASIQAAEKLFADHAFFVEGRKQMEILDAIRVAIRGFNALNISDEDTKMHYLHLLQKNCNILEEKLGLAITRFEDMGFSKIVSPLARLKAMQAARANLIGGTTGTPVPIPTPMLTQFNNSATASSEVTLGELPVPANDGVAPKTDQEASVPKPATL